MNEEAIQQIKNAIKEMMRLIVDKGQPLDNQTKKLVSEAMSHAENRILELRQQDQSKAALQEPFQGQVQETQLPSTAIGNAPIPEAQLLWILAGQQEDVFLKYLQEYQTPQTLSLLNNPQELERTIQFLHSMMPSGQQPVIDGIQHANLNSSNIWGSKYDANTGKMTVRFQNGSEYEYDGVPANIYRAFIDGDATAKTSGKNKYGVWWKGKNPSLGAAMNQYIKQGAFPYRKIA